MTIRQATIVFLVGVMLGAAIAGCCMTGASAAPTEDAITTPAPFYSLDRFTVIALYDSLALCRKVGVTNGRLDVECVPVPSGSYLLVPNTEPTPTQKAD